jgi:hypothetical protein
VSDLAQWEFARAARVPKMVRAQRFLRESAFPRGVALRKSHGIRSALKRMTIATFTLCIAGSVFAAETQPMPEYLPVHVRSELASLDLRFRFDAQRLMLEAEYELRNESQRPIAVFDRGDTIAIANKRLVAGDTEVPMIAQDGERVILSHLALELPKPAPTVPRISLAARVETGSSSRGQFRIELPQDVQEVRYCIGVAPFDDDHFTALDPKYGVSLWRTAFTVAALQTPICSPWFSLREDRFAES